MRQAVLTDLPPEIGPAADGAERLAPYARKLRAEHPGLNTLNSDAPRGARFVEQTVGKAMRDLYNPAQLDVVQRTEVLLRAAHGSEDTSR